MCTPFSNNIYCDEAGFTGNNLLVTDQPYFVFSSVAIELDEARGAVQRAIQDYRLQGNELKGNRVANSHNMRDAAMWLIEKYASSSRIFISEKRFALAAKFFEYVFEPVLASQSSMFYKSRFHRFISNMLYLELTVGGRHAEEVFSGFESMMRKRDFAALESLALTETSESQMSPVLRQVLTFCFCHKPTIESELAGLRDRESDGFAKWILELSTTALFGLLSWWGERIDGIKVYCDSSKPLIASGDFFDVMINRQDKVYFDIDGIEHPITFNLAQPIELVDSRGNPGIQIADVFASSIAYSLKFPDDPFSKKCQEFYESILHVPVFPELDYADLNQPYSFVNALILQELVGRTLKGENLFDQMPEFIVNATQLHRQWLVETSQ